MIGRMSVERQRTLYGIADDLIVFHYENTHGGSIAPALPGVALRTCQVVVSFAADTLGQTWETRRIVA
jgi:hypothetical protein